MVMMMVLLGGLWWAYFGSGDDVAAGAALASRAEGEVPELAFWGYSMGHLVHIGGLVLLAAGLQEVMVSPRNHLSTRWALTLAVGVAIFLGAEALLRKVFRVGSWIVLAVAAVACAVVGAYGRHVSGLVELELLATVVVAALVAVPSSASSPEPAAAVS
jgi:low temperature requirement protein LtrA